MSLVTSHGHSHFGWRTVGKALALVTLSATAVLAQDAYQTTPPPEPDPYPQMQTTLAPSVLANPLDKLPQSLFPEGNHTYTASGHAFVFGKGLGPATVIRDTTHIDVKTSAGDVTIDPDSEDRSLVDVKMPSGTLYRASLKPSANGKDCTATIDAKRHVDFKDNGHGIDIDVHGFSFVPFKVVLVRAS